MITLATLKLVGVVPLLARLPLAQEAPWLTPIGTLKGWMDSTILPLAGFVAAAGVVMMVGGHLQESGTWTSRGKSAIFAACAALAVYAMLPTLLSAAQSLGGG